VRGITSGFTPTLILSRQGSFVQKVPTCTKSQDGKLNIRLSVRILCIVVGSCLVFFALSQLSYRYQFIPSILIGIGIVFLIISYIRRRRKRLRTMLATKSKKECTNDQDGDNDPSRNINNRWDKFEAGISLEQKANANKDPTSIPHKMPPREKP
jgi:uncharacterized membrane protein